MEQKVNPWKANLTNGLILGLVGVAYILLMYFLDLMINKVQGYIFIVLQIVLLFYLLKSYRDNYMHGQITFGQSVGAGVIICLYSAIILAIFYYILYGLIDPNLIAKQLAFTEEVMVKRGMPQSAIDTGMAIQTKMMKPAIIAATSIFGRVLGGVVMSLLVSIFIKKEGNPLIDTPAN